MTSMGFLLRRGAAQVGLLGAVLALVVAGAVLVGTCTLLLTSGQASALDTTLRRSDPRDLAVEVTLRTRTAEPGALVADVTDVLTEVLAPARPEVSAWLTSHVRPVTTAGAGAAGVDPSRAAAHAYVVSADDLAEHARLESGRWPGADARDPLEVAVPVAVARRLDLAPGAELVLEELRDGTDREDVPGAAAVRLVVVGTFTPTVDGTGAWDRDLVRGAGVDPAWELPTATPRPPVTAYGPFVAAPEALRGSAVAVDRASLVARPDLAGADARARDAVREAVATVPDELRTEVGERAAQVRVRTDLARTIASAEVQGRVTASVVLAVALLGTALAAAALGLVGRLMTARRAAESRLVAARGASRRRLVAFAAAEAAVLATVGAALAFPLATALFRALTRTGTASPGGSVGAGAPGVPAAAVLLGALALTAVLVVPAAGAADRDPRPRRDPRGRRGRVARTSAELLLVAGAVAGYLQLRGRPFSAGGAVDPVLVVVPVLCLAAGAAVALRVVPWVARWAESRARRSRGLVLPLASWEIARRGHSAGAALLLVLAAAGATFGTSLGATWTTSARDQAEASVGADVAVGLTAAAPFAQQLALVDLTRADVVPVTDREVALGGAGGEGTAVPETRLVAVDTAAGLLRGRPPGGVPWPELTEGLGPAAAADGIVLPADADGVRLTVRGTAGDPAEPLPVSLATTVVVQAPGGARHALEGWEVPLDGRPHEVDLPFPVAQRGAGGEMQVVALVGRIALGDTDGLTLRAESVPLEVATTVTATGTDAPVEGPTGGWGAAVATDHEDRLRGPEVVVAPDGAGATVTGRAGLIAHMLVVGDAGLVLSAFPPPAEVPVLVTDALAAAIAAEPGTALSLDVGPATVVARVAAVAPGALPRGADLLADQDALTRAAVATGVPAGLVDAWWLVGAADPATAVEAVTAAGLGEAVTRDALAAELTADPQRIGVQLALWLLVGAAGVLAVAGTAVQTVATLDARAVDVARLQGMGVPRRSLVGALVVEHGVVSLLVVVAGGAVGALVASTVGPLLVVSPAGLAPVPAPVPVWSWPVQTGLLAALLVACVAVVVPVTAGLVRRATAAHLRMDGGR